MSDFQEFSLTKDEGFNFDLTKADPSIRKIRLEATYTGTQVQVGNKTESADLDLMALLLTPKSKIKSNLDVVFWGEIPSTKQSLKTHFSGAVKLPEDIRNGGTEKMFIDASLIPEDTPIVALYVNVYDDPKVPYQFTFSEIEDASISLFNDETNECLVKYNLTKDFAGVTMLHIGDLIKASDGGVTFEPVGNGGNMNLNQVCQFYFQ